MAGNGGLFSDRTVAKQHVSQFSTTYNNYYVIFCFMQSVLDIIVLVFLEKPANGY